MDTSTRSLGVRLPLRTLSDQHLEILEIPLARSFWVLSCMGRGAECQASVVEWDTVWCGVVGHKIHFQFNGQRFQNKEMSFARDYLQADGKTLLDEYLCLYSFIFWHLSESFHANKFPTSHNVYYMHYWISCGK